ncbi:MAG: hypothetical protein RIC88_09815 [Ekhidna sp.]
MNKIVLTILAITMALVGRAQERIENNYPDTIRMTADEGTEMVFAFDRISKKEAYISNELWKSTISVMETATKNSSIDGGKLVSYEKINVNEKEVVRINIDPLMKGETYIIGTDGTEEFEYNRIEFLIKLESLSISFILNDLSNVASIKEVDIESLWSQIDQKFIDEGKRNLYLGTGKFNYGNAKIDQLSAKDIGIDNIEITFIGIGLGYYRDRFVPDLGSKVSFNLQDRLGNDWMKFGILYTQQFFFSRGETNEYQLDRNGWLTGFWKINTKGGDEFGVGIGGLVHRDGGYFEGSTWKLSLYNKGVNSKLTFSPELIFTNGFKSAFPALRFGLSF